VAVKLVVGVAVRVAGREGVMDTVMEVLRVRVAVADSVAEAEGVFL